MTTVTNATAAKTRSASSAETLRLVRQIHLYFGLLITPALLFFAFTGAMQTLSLHEAAGTSYTPPTALAVWAQIHKKQTWMLPARRPPVREDHRDSAAKPTKSPTQFASPARPDAAPQQKSGDDRGSRANSPKFSAAPPTTAAAPRSSSAPEPVTLSAKQKQHLPLKLFFLLVSLGLFTSTLTGIYMAYRYDRNKLLVTGLLLAGVVIPLVLLPF